MIKENVIGEYRIDKDFYPGVNAEWQFAHYKFFITKEDEIIFICMNDKGNTRKIFKHKISYIDGPPALWKIQSDSTHHIIQNQPTLYRSHNDFYYVFNSTKYGNMFFRKSDD